jgi:protein tyrosine phosphatase type 4A
MAQVSNRPSLVERGSMRFLIIDCPTDANLEAYLREMRANGVVDLVRACESGYSRDAVERAGVRVHDVAFQDGEPPPAGVIASWLKVCAGAFGKGNADKKAVAVHCVAGLGRAPVLVAIALIEDGMEPLDAVTLIRSKRRGAINAKQLNYLQDSYQRSGKKGCVVA